MHDIANKSINGFRIIGGDCLDVLKRLPSESVQCCVTSPPYFGLRDYGVDGQIGLEATPLEFVTKMVNVFEEVRRVLKKDGTLWLNLGDSYNGSGGDHKVGGKNDAGFQSDIMRGVQKKAVSTLKPKDLIGIPWRVAFALQDAGWWLRQDIIWSKPNPMPESVTDRCTKAHEYIFLLTKSAKYFYNADAVKEAASDATNSRDKYARTGYAKETRDGFVNHLDPTSGTHRDCNGERNKRSVWTVTIQPYSDAHFATFPPKLIEPCILAGSREGDTVLDPFNGSGTTGFVSLRNRRNYIGIELNTEYIAIAERRLKEVQVKLF